MEPLLYFAINLTIEIAKTKNVEAIDYVLCTLDVVLSDEDFEQYFDQVSIYLEKNYPDVLEWLVEFLNSEEDTNNTEDITSNTATATLNKKDTKNDSSSIKDHQILQQYQLLNAILNQKVYADLIRFNSHFKNEEQPIFKVYHEDLIHLLLDEGFNSDHYEVIEDKLFISKAAKSFLSEHYNLECIESLIGEKENRGDIKDA